MGQNVSNEPLEIVRFSELRKYIPVGRTRRDDLIKAGHLEVVHLAAPLKRKDGGVSVPRARGITMRSIRKYQATVMGLAEQEAEDGARADKAPA